MGFSIGGIVNKAGDITKALVPGQKDYLDFSGGQDSDPYSMSPEKVAKRAQDRLALAQLTGGRGVNNTEKATARVNAAGLSLTGGDAYAYLAKLTSKGGVAGKKAAYLSQLIAMENIRNPGRRVER